MHYTETMKISLDSHSLIIQWADGNVSAYPYLWLRDTDPSGFHPQTGERTFDLSTVALDIKAIDASIDGETLVVNWPDKPKPSCFSLDWIRQHRPGQQRHDPASEEPIHWRGDQEASTIARFCATEIIESEQVLADWLRTTKRYGLSIVDGLADTTDAGQAIARQVASLRTTNFGTTFEVISKSDPNNLAYTAEALPLHTDLTNQELPPGYQFLHCLSNDAVGGGSIFCDGFAVAADMQDQEPELADRLATTLVPHRFHDNETDIRARKSVITRSFEGRTIEICFNAHLADILDLEADELIPFYEAYRSFMLMTRSKAYTVSLRLMAGEMVVFDNRRVLHGREAFEQGSGKRHLHGCYVDRADWDSRLRVLARSKAAA